MSDADSPGQKTPLDLLAEDAVRDSFETFREEMAAAMLFPEKRQIRKYCLGAALSRFGPEGLYAEFGVWRGHGVNLFAKQLPRDVTVWGFDSFEGLEEDWTGHARGGQAGRFTLKGKLPEVEPNVRLVKGWVQDTVPDWLSEHPEPASFLHLDLDTYTPTRFVLDALRPRLRAGTVLLFDELYGYPGWRHHEWRALCEALPDTELRYIAFSEQAVGIELASPPSDT